MGGEGCPKRTHVETVKFILKIYIFVGLGVFRKVGSNAFQEEEERNLATLGSIR